MAHARLSPSAAKRWMNCPGSVRMIESLDKKDKPSKYAAEGTVAHEICEICLLKEKEPKDFLGEKRQADGFTFTVTQDMVDACTVYVDYIRQFLEEKSVKMHVEVRCSLKSLDVEGLDGGTSDCLLVDQKNKTIEVVDYKHGAGVAVEVIENPQAMSYGLGALIQIQEEMSDAKVVSVDDWKVYLTIVQPRAHHKDGPVRSWAIGGKELYAWGRDELIPAAQECHNEDAALVPSDDACRFCAASGTCPKLYEKTQEIAIADFDDDKFPEPEKMTAEQKMIVMDHIGMIRSFLVAVESQVKDEVEAGCKDYEGKYKLVRKSTQRRLLEDAFDEDFSPLLDYMEEDDMYERKPKGVGALEAKLKEKMKEQGIKGFTKKAKEIMDEVTEKPEGELVIAPQSDKRAAVRPSLTSDFADLN